MKKSDIKILFMGTPDISAFVLNELIENGFNIIGVIAQPDRPIGRHHVLEPVPTKQIAVQHNIPVYQPIKIRNEYDFVNIIKPDVIVTLAYGQIIPQGLIDIPKYGCINLHGSLLPKYRGAAPIQYALLNNDTITGFSLMEMTKDMDAGRVYKTLSLPIDDNDNYSSLLEKMKTCARDLILSSLEDYIDGKLTGIPQDETKVTFSPSIKSDEEKIDLNNSLESCRGKIRALSYIPGAYLFLDNEKIKIFKASIIPDAHIGEINTIVKADKTGLYLQHKDGIISILELQRQGKNKMDFRSFVNGFPQILGRKLS